MRREAQDVKREADDKVTLASGTGVGPPCLRVVVVSVLLRLHSPGAADGDTDDQALASFHLAAIDNCGTEGTQPDLITSDNYRYPEHYIRTDIMRLAETHRPYEARPFGSCTNFV